MSMRPFLLLPCLLLACRPTAEGGPEEPAPWDSLEDLPLDPFRQMLETPIDGAVAPTRIVAGQERAWAAVLDGAAGRVHLLDGRYRHDGATWCLDAARWPELEAGEQRQGECADGYVELHRGFVEPPLEPVAIAAGSGLWVLDAGGRLLRAEDDPLACHPWDWFRLADLGEIDPAVEGSPLVAAGDGVAWVADATRLRGFDAGGVQVAGYSLPSQVRDLAVSGGQPWAATEGGAWSGGMAWELASGGRRIAADGDAGAWVTVSGELVHLPDGQEIPVPGLLGPLAVDAASGKVYLLVEGGVAVVDGGVERARYALDGLVDIAATPSHELLLLDESGTVSVRFDETALAGPRPLPVFIATFIERPRSSDEDVPCRGDDGVDAFVDGVLANRALLDDLPAPAALGITPWFARRAAECGDQARLEDAWRVPRTGVGVLFHEQPDCAGDPDCLDAFLLDQAGYVQALGPRVTWASGLSPLGDSGDDWVASLGRTGLVGRYAFFSMSLLPGVSHLDDPRAKDPWPVETGDLATGWRAASAAEPAAGSGPVSFYPGDSRPAFDESACAGLFVAECHVLGQGGAQVLDAADVAVLDLLLHRALAERPRGAGAWYFHLPDLGQWDYGEGCTVDGRRWSGDSCPAAPLQDWLLDVHARLVRAGIATWALPGDLDLP